MYAIRCQADATRTTPRRLLGELEMAGRRATSTGIMARRLATSLTPALILAEIRLAYEIILLQRLGRIREDNRSRLQDIAAVRNRQRHERVLLNQ